MESQRDIGRKLLIEVRTRFERQDWDTVLAVFKRARDTLKGERALRLEATCLAARALAARKDRTAGRRLLRTVSADGYAKSVHYEFLARAFLDLKQYQEAAFACERAHEIREAEQV